MHFFSGLKKRTSGRSILEMIAFLALASLLSLSALLGIRYLKIKKSVNSILSDVSLGLENLKSQEEFGNFEPNYKLESSKDIYLRRDYYNDETITDVVIVNNISKDECIELLRRDTGNVTFWSMSEEINRLIRPIDCSLDENEVFFTSDYKEIYSCNRGCPDDAECSDEYECVCGIGYQINPSTGTCEELICPETLAAVEDEACCEKFYGIWDGNECFCERDYYFNLEKCVPLGSFCSYTLVSGSEEPPEADCAYTLTPGREEAPKADCTYTLTPGKQAAAKADCAYALTPGKEENAKADCSYEYRIVDGVSSLISSKPRGGCSANEYCSLNYSGENCTGSIDESKTIYGSCTPSSLSYTMCKKEISPSTVTISKGCGENEYCSLNYSDENCTGSIDESKTIYGSCTPSDLSYTMCKKKLKPANLKVKEMCQDGTYCNLSWKDKDCNAFNSDEDHLYGTCQAPNDTEPAVCPIDKEEEK